MKVDLKIMGRFCELTRLVQETVEEAVPLGQTNAQGDFEEYAVSASYIQELEDALQSLGVEILTQFAWNKEEE